MTVELEIEFHEQEIPPRCRKPRPIGHKEKVSVKIREASPESAPVAFIVGSLRERPVDVRLFKGQLYKEARITFYNGKESEEYPFESIPWESVFRTYSRENLTKAEYIAHLKLTSREYLIVNNVLFRRCWEPYYEITTFGLSGCGTAIFPEYCGKSRKEVYGYSALDKTLAIEDAITIAKSRHDEDSIMSISQLSQGTIEVLIPKACKRKFKRQGEWARLQK